MTHAAQNELAALKAEVARLKAIIERHREPLRQAEASLTGNLRRADKMLRHSGSGRTKSGESSQAVADLRVALALEQAKCRTLIDVSNTLAAELQQLINIAQTNTEPTPEVLQAAQEAVDVIEHLQTLWPTDENQN